MCRHLLITTTALPGVNDPWKFKQIKFDVLHMGMLLGNLDEAQDSGWGLSDGNMYTKAGGPYWIGQDMEWVEELDPTRMLLGHVRKASPGTDRDTALAAHPYAFRILGGERERMLTVAHNGFLTGTGAHVYNSNTPNTDSYRAFAILANMVTERQDLTPEIIQEWLGNFYDDSQYAFTFYLDDTLWALRGNRLLYSCTFGDGYIVHTSKAVLVSLGFYVKRAWGFQLGEIAEITPDTLVKFSPGSHTLDYFTVKPKFKTRVYTTAANESYFRRETATTPPRQTGVNPTVPAAGATGVVVANPVAGNHENDNSTSASELVDAARTAQGALNMLLAKAAPMRAAIMKWWIAASLDYTDNHGVPDHIVINNLPLHEFKQFIMMAAPVGAGTLITHRQKALIQAWNESINDARDLDCQRQVFRNIPFFAVPELNSRFVDDTQSVAALQLMIGMWKGGALRDEIWRAVHEYINSIPMSSANR